MQSREQRKYYTTSCSVKLKSMDDWQDLRPGWDRKSFGGFLTATPDLSKTPMVQLTSPPNKDEVMKRLASEETRINSSVKMQSLKALVEDIYVTRQQRMHWDLRKDIEQKHKASSEVGALQQTADNLPVQDISYEPNTFVAVRHDEDGDNSPFWVGKISRVKNNDDNTTTLRVQWYDVQDGSDVYTGKYTPSNRTPCRKRFTAWTQDIDSNMVLVTFNGLTARSTIDGETVKVIQAKVNSVS